VIFGRSLACLLLAGTLGPAAAQDAAAGRQKAAMCAACHGVNGLATLPDAPHLAGQPASYLVAQLRAFRAGARRNEVMSVVTKTLSDGDIDDIAAWYSAQKISVQISP
jgi:cytochrome c553